MEFVDFVVDFYGDGVVLELFFIFGFGEFVLLFLVEVGGEDDFVVEGVEVFLEFGVGVFFEDDEVVG